MGFRSTLVTSDDKITWTDWFREKYVNVFIFPEDYCGAIAISSERKANRLEDKGLYRDILKVLRENQFDLIFVLVWLHECGGITRVELCTDENRQSTPVYITEPGEWDNSEEITHFYCDCHSF